MHVIISVKDFKAIVTHAETLRGSIAAHFSFPTRPLQFSYQNFGIHSEFTLMTTGDYRGASSTPNPALVTNRSFSRQESVAVAAPSRSAAEMPPPPPPVVNRPPPSQSQRPTLKETMRKAKPKETDTDPDSLFMPVDDEQAWDPPNYEEEEEMLGWDATNEHPSASFHQTFRDSGSNGNRSIPVPPRRFPDEEGLEPTQRLSQVSVVDLHSGPCS
jgi:cell cycle checkpoint control protein RAD9A